jgi:hypothetical protein
MLCGHGFGLCLSQQRLANIFGQGATFNQPTDQSHHGAFADRSIPFRSLRVDRQRGHGYGSHHSEGQRTARQLRASRRLAPCSHRRRCKRGRLIQN